MRKLLKNKIKGFTLIELMIVVAIIGILAAIAIPNFIRYQLKSKTTEAKTVMGGIKTSQEAFRAEMDNYGSITSPQPPAYGGTVKTDWGSAPCLSTCNRTNTGIVNCTTFDCIGYSPSGQVYYRYNSPAIVATPATGLVAEFAIGAQADLDGDTSIGSFTYQSSNTTSTTNGALADGMSGCASGLPGGFIHDCAPGKY